MFICHLVNQGVAHELVVLEILIQLLDQPTDDGVEIAVGVMREVGAFIEQSSPKATEGIFARFRKALQEQTKISTRVQYMIEVLFQIRKDKYKDNPILPEGLDLVEEDEQITHEIALDEELQVQESLSTSPYLRQRFSVSNYSIDSTDIFKFDPNFLQNEERYKQLKEEILGSDDEDDDSDEEDEDEDEDVGGGGMSLSHPCVVVL